MKKNNFAPIETIISVAKKGGMFILVDDEKRENEGDLVISSSDSTAKNINFMAKHGSGLIFLGLECAEYFKELILDDTGIASAFSRNSFEAFAHNFFLTHNLAGRLLHVTHHRPW